MEQSEALGADRKPALSCNSHSNAVARHLTNEEHEHAISTDLSTENLDPELQRLVTSQSSLPPYRCTPSTHQTQRSGPPGNLLRYYFKIIKKKMEGYSSVVPCLPRALEALGSSLSTTK